MKSLFKMDQDRSTNSDRTSIIYGFEPRNLENKDDSSQDVIKESERVFLSFTFFVPSDKKARIIPNRSK